MPVGLRRQEDLPHTKRVMLPILFSSQKSHFQEKNLLAKWRRQLKKKGIALLLPQRGHNTVMVLIFRALYSVMLLVINN